MSRQSPAGATAERRYRDALARATEDVVRRQVDAGVDIVNDGEYGKSSWANYVLERLTGFEARPDRLFDAVWLGRDRIRFREFMKENYPRGATSVPGHVCVGPITYTRAREHPAQHRRSEGGASRPPARPRVS